MSQALNAKIFDLLISPHVTEKSMRHMVSNIYTFKVRLDANKTQIKNAVTQIYNVNVERVNIVRYKPESKRNMKGHRGFTKACNYAMVKLISGDLIDIEKPLSDEKES